MRAMKSVKSMKMPAVRMKPAKRAMKSMNAKRKPAVRMKPMGPVQDGDKSKDDRIVDLRVALEVEWYKQHRLYEELVQTRAEAAAWKAKIAMFEEEKKKQVAIVPDTGELWVKAGDVVLSIKVVPPLVPIVAPPKALDSELADVRCSKAVGPSMD
mgnify:CR=1 FL=1